MPPELLNFILAVLGNMGVQPEHRKRMAEPGEPLTDGSRLICTATDNTNWVTHYEFIYKETLGPQRQSRARTNYCVAAASRDTNGLTKVLGNGGYMRRFNTYQDLISYESKPRIRY
jgi:hypothetical protein